MITDGPGGTRFYLGTHKPRWLWDPAADFPLFVSHRTLRAYAVLKPATHPWALDSGGFTEIAKYGRRTISPREYVQAVARYDAEIGLLEWAAPQDWMCEEAMITGGMAGKVRCAGTGLSELEHQRRTVANYLELCRLWPEYSSARCPFIPVLQGSDTPSYLRCAALYRGQGVRLRRLPLVGLGSVCRRQGTAEIGELACELGLRFPLHGFGVKTQGLARYGHMLASADSMAWSYAARRSAPLPGHTHGHCGNCLAFARQWRTRLLSAP